MAQNEYVIEMLERAFLVQQKRVWSLEMLDKIERRQLLAKAPAAEREKLRASLEGNLRVSKVILDEIAKELGFSSSLRKLLDPQFVVGAPGEGIAQTSLDKLDRADSAELEKGTQHYAAMMRELLVTHEAFLQDVQDRVREDVEIQTVLQGF